MRHPIYGGGILVFMGLALLRPTSTVVLSCVLGLGWAIVQARLEELDLVQPLPACQEYMEQVPRFVPSPSAEVVMSIIGLFRARFTVG